VVDKYKYKQPLQPKRQQATESYRLCNILSDKGDLYSLITNYLDDVTRGIPISIILPFES